MIRKPTRWRTWRRSEDARRQKGATEAARCVMIRAPEGCESPEGRPCESPEGCERGCPHVEVPPKGAHDASPPKGANEDAHSSGAPERCARCESPEGCVRRCARGASPWCHGSGGAGTRGAVCGGC